MTATPPLLTPAASVAQPSHHYSIPSRALCPYPNSTDSLLRFTTKACGGRGARVPGEQRRSSRLTAINKNIPHLSAHHAAALKAGGTLRGSPILSREAAWLFSTYCHIPLIFSYREDDPATITSPAAGLQHSRLDIQRGMTHIPFT